MYLTEANNDLFPKLEIGNFNLRLTKKEKDIYDSINEMYSRYKSFLNSLYNHLGSDFIIKFNYGYYYSILERKWDNKIIFYVKDNKRYAYIDYETREVIKSNFYINIQDE